MIRPPSIQSAFDAYYSGDPAFKQLPADADDDARKAHAHKWQVARQTGRLDGLLRPGEIPTKFVLRQVDGETWRQFVDRFWYMPVTSERHIGPAIGPAVLLRLALQSVTGFDFAVKRSPDPKWDGWEMAQADIIKQLDSIDRKIVTELGDQILERMSDISKKA